MSEWGIFMSLKDSNNSRTQRGMPKTGCVEACRRVHEIFQLEPSILRKVLLGGTRAISNKREKEGK